jgi:putative endonuclease
MPKKFTSKTQKIGEIGESIACKWLLNKGFVVIDRNYTKKYGEIDIIASKDDNIHFIEVKTVSCEMGENDEVLASTFNPEDNIHPHKLRRFINTVQVYLMSKHIPEDKKYQIDLISVFYDKTKKRAKVKILENIA